MALVDAAVYLPWQPMFVGAATPAFGNMLIDAASEKAAAVFYPPKAGDITKIIWRTNTVTTGDTVDVRVETVDATTGDPTGTLWGTNTNASQVVANGDDNVAFTTTLTADATVVAVTTPMAVVIANGGGGGNMNVANFTATTGQLPYTDLFTASWSKSTNTPVIGLEYDDGSYEIVPGMWPMSAINSVSFGSGSTPDERGMVFTCPVDCVVSGAWFSADMDGDVDVVLYDTDGASALATISLDTNIRGGLSGATFQVPFADVTLAAGSVYRLVLKPSSGTTLILHDFDVTAAAVMDSFPGKSAFHYTSAKDPTGTGSWTDVTTKRPFMGLYVTQLDNGAGGGGGGIGGRVIGG